MSPSATPIGLVVAFLLAGCGRGTTSVRPLAPAVSAPKLPAVELTALDGRGWSTTAVAGKISVIDVWATYCAPCRKAFPVLGRLAAARPDIAVIGVSLDDEDATVTRFLAEVPATFAIVRDHQQQLQHALTVTALPTVMLVDQAGRIRLRVDNAAEADYDALLGLVDTLRAQAR